MSACVCCTAARDSSVGEAVKRAAKAEARRRVRISRRAITRTILEDLLDTCADGGPAALRDRALLLVAFGSGGRRRSELASLKVEQLVEELPVPADPANPQSPHLPCMTIELGRSEEHTSELQSLMRNSYADFCLKKKNNQTANHQNRT